MPPRKYTDEQLAEAVAASRTMNEVLKRIGLVPRGGNYETVRERIRFLRIDARHLSRIVLNGCSDREIAEAARSSRSYAETMQRLGVRWSGGNHGALKRRLIAMRVDTSHFVGSGWRKGVSTPVAARRPLARFLVKGRLVQTGDLKRRLLEEGVLRPVCQGCRRGRWNGRPIPLELDHVNGDRRDNRLENLRVLCPNCHAQTRTYRGRNIGRAANV